VLLAPVVPAAHGGEPIELPVDPTALWIPQPEIAHQVFWDATPTPMAEQFAALLSPESPRAVLEATRWLVELDLRTVRAPTYVFAADRDLLVPAPLVESLARELGAVCTTLPDQGHGISTDPVWESVAATMHEWLLDTTT
jgi:pimeloyl-ACP methyl ester carboxylesterase